MCVCLQSCVQSMKLKKKIEIKTACTFVFKIATQPTKCPKKKYLTETRTLEVLLPELYIHSFHS